MMTTSNADMFEAEGAAQVAAPDRLKAIQTLAEQARDLEVAIASLEEIVSNNKGLLNLLKTKEIPEALAEIGMTSFNLEDGTSVEVVNFVAGSLPKDPEKKKVAIDYAVTIGGEALIKNTIVLAFEKSEHNIAKDLAESLREQGFTPVEEESIHPQTLLAFIRERLRDGEEVDVEKLGCFSGRKTEIKLPKAPKPKKAK